jgi:hypothetical protein
VSTPDGGDAEIYADVTPGTFDSLMINRFSDGDPLDLLAEFAIQANGVILAPGDCLAMLTAEAQREHLPEDFPSDLIIIRNGDDIREVLRTS